MFDESAVTVRRAVAHAAAAVQPLARGAARVMLRSDAFATVLNAVEERAGQLVLYPRRDYRVSDLVDFFLHTDRPSRPFAWHCRIDGATFVVPVDPRFPRPSPASDPWGPATYWRRAANRKIRQFYELYLRRRPSGTFVDVGANWGMHSYPFAAAGYRCVCFEPQSICRDFIRRVCDLNAFDRVAIAASVVGASCESAVPFFESEVEAFSSVSEEHVAMHQRAFRRRTIECVTLDSYCAAHEVAPTIVKIDTEGFEWEVLQGGSATLRACRPALLVEVSTSIDKQHAMWNTLASLGYRCYSINRSLGTRYPRWPFAAVTTAADFVARQADGNGNGAYESDADFVFLQAHDDVLLGENGSNGHAPCRGDRVQ